MTPFTTARIEKLRARAEKATKGPWRAMSDMVYGDPDNDGWTAVAASPCPRSPRGSAHHSQWLRDSTFIAAADPLTIIAALDEIERLRALLRQIDGTIDLRRGGDTITMLTEVRRLAQAGESLQGGT